MTKAAMHFGAKLAMIGKDPVLHTAAHTSHTTTTHAAAHTAHAAAHAAHSSSP